MKIQSHVKSMIRLAVKPSVARVKLGFPISLLALMCLFNESALGVAPRDFVPDVTFTGSALNGWHVLGQAGWRADDGEIVGAPTQTNGGWLMLDKGYQDVEIY